MTSPAELDASSEFLSFSLGGQPYAVPIHAVREIKSWVDPSPLPRTPSYVLGVVNLRGHVVPILCLAEKLSQTRRETDGARPVVIVLQVADRSFGIAVDAVSDILTIPTDDLQSPPDSLGIEGDDCITALYLLDDSLVRIITADRLLPKPEGVAA